MSRELTCRAIPDEIAEEYRDEVRRYKLNQKAQANGKAEAESYKMACKAREEKKKAELEEANANRRRELERTRKLRRNLLQMLAWMALGIATVVAVKAQLVHPYIGSGIVSICLLAEGWLLRSAQGLTKRNG